MDAQFPRSVAIDGTRLPMPARPREWVERQGKKKRPIYADPDITFHTMEKPDGGDARYNSSQGYGATTVVNVNTGNGLPQTTPAFSVADMAMTYTQEHLLGVPLLKFLGETSNVDAIYMDTGYSIHEDVRIAVRRTGISPLMPLHPIHQTTHGVWDGITAAADVLVCPGTPQSLLSIKGVSGDDLTALGNERAAYELKQHGRAAENGTQRFSCPARRGQARCPLFSPSMKLPLSVATVFNPPTSRHKICTQETVTVPEDMLSFLQPDPVGTNAHQDRAGYRQTVESSYRQLKSLTSGGLTRDAVAVRRLVKFAILYGCIVATENVRRALTKLKANLSATLLELTHRLPWLDMKSPVLQGLRDTTTGRGPPG